MPTMNQSEFGADVSLDPSDPYARRSQTFPRLEPEMMDRVSAFGSEIEVKKDTTLFSRGERHTDFFLIRSGSIEILDPLGDGSLRVLAHQGEREFTGELDLFNDREILVTARAAEDSRLIRLERSSFLRMMSAEPDIGEIVTRALILRRVGFIKHGQAGVVLIGPGHAADTLRLQRFLTRNGYPHRLIDSDIDEHAGEMVAALKICALSLPVIVPPGKPVLQNPATQELADVLGLTEAIDPAEVYDVLVVGAGPAGLAAAVYAASEGLKTIVIEGVAPGGQAGTSSKIENYLGFPTGISGQALAGRAQVQAQRFGARLAISRMAVSVDCSELPYRTVLDDGQKVSAKAIVVATGARYRKPDLPNYERFEGQGIHYAATAMEAQLCQHQEVVVVGGGNSAGQAAMFLSQWVRHLHIVVRGSGLKETMSDYLIQRIEKSHRITLHPYSEISAIDGDRYLTSVTWTNRLNAERVTRPVSNIFMMIGAAPNTEWLNGCVKLDKSGFVETGIMAGVVTSGSPFETSAPGIFAVGDVRSGSIKRVASGVGEGSVVVQAIHQYLKQIPRL
jgi:thioredoxin reductase (NADPH)